jgi:hypothetical protein
LDDSTFSLTLNPRSQQGTFYCDVRYVLVQ